MSSKRRTKRPRATRSVHLLSRPELRRLARCLRAPPRESGIAGARWSAARIQRLLRKRFDIRLSARYALRRLRSAGIRVKLVRAREPRLARRACESLRRTLRRVPREAGLADDRWTRARIVELIERRFKKRFSPAHAGRIARRLRGRGLGRARDRRLTREQGRALREALRPCRSTKHPPTWTRAQVVALIEERFGVHYHPQSIPALLKRWKIRVELSPQLRGTERPSQSQLSDLAAALAAPPSAVGIAASRWEQRYLAAFLRSHFALEYPVRGLYRRIERWGVHIERRASAGGVCPLTFEQRQTLGVVLSQPPRLAGFSVPRWSRALVARWIHTQFQVCYAPSSIPHLLRRAGLQLRATQSDLNANVITHSVCSSHAESVHRPSPDGALDRAPRRIEAEFR